MPRAADVRTRRAYFDCRYGQLHVHTAFPATGGFDERVTLFCVHPAGASGRVFGRFLALAAGQRSVYAADLPGCGESDPSPSADPAEAGAALADLAAELRLRQLDVLGIGSGAAVAVELALAKPTLVRGIVLAGDVPAARADLLARTPGAARVHGLEAAAFPAGRLDEVAAELVRRVDTLLR